MQPRAVNNDARDIPTSKIPTRSVLDDLVTTLQHHDSISQVASHERTTLITKRGRSPSPDGGKADLPKKTKVSLLDVSLQITQRESSDSGGSWCIDNMHGLESKGSSPASTDGTCRKATFSGRAHCVRTLETSKLLKRNFDVSEKGQTLGSTTHTVVPKETISIQGYMQKAPEGALMFVDQLKLAQKLAMALLQYHSTPWLNEYWRLEDVSLFGSYTRPLEEDLHTLHLRAELHDSVRTLTMESIEDTEVTTPPPDMEENKLQYGINNMPLFSLGIALLEIGHWKPLHTFRRAQENDVITARRLAVRQTRLGPKFQDMAQKCLDCDFGSGKDLGKPQLQSAVHGEVVCRLGDMIQALTLL